jgi:predicted AlkP superfamily pyrophosphatase or phosphodiesterase
VSTQQRLRVLWVVLDGMGAEHFQLALQHGQHPAITRMGREGSISPMQPASPVCQTPPALLALFTGTQPSQNGVWGYYMPHPARREESLSGFHAELDGTRTIWQELEERGEGYSLMNVAFRADPVWKGPAEHLVLGFDGYRLWRKPSLYRVTGGRKKIDYHGLRLRGGTGPSQTMSLSKGASLRTRLAVGEGRLVSMTAGTRAFAHLLEPGLLLLNPVNDVVCRGTAAKGVGSDGFLEMSVFHLVRRINSSREPSAQVPMEAELLASRISFQRKADLMVEQAKDRDARLVVGYFPVIDDFNHAYFDLLLAGDIRASALFQGCAAMVDDLLGRLMQEMESGTLLVVSSDHGAMAHHGSLHINEAFADAGLVRRSAAGYDFRGSSAWYHPSDCGQVVMKSGAEKGPLLGRVKAIIERLNADLGANIGVLDGDSGSPFLAFLYPKGDLYFTGRPPRRKGKSLDTKRAGGHHLSPLSPTPWIRAALGLWSTGRTPGDLPALPRENVEMKKFLMESMGLA